MLSFENVCISCLGKTTQTPAILEKLQVLFVASANINGGYMQLLLARLYLITHLGKQSACKTILQQGD